jgi:hypothetical protein
MVSHAVAVSSRRNGSKSAFGALQSPATRKINKLRSSDGYRRLPLTPDSSNPDHFLSSPSIFLAFRIISKTERRVGNYYVRIRTRLCPLPLFALSVLAQNSPTGTAKFEVAAMPELDTGVLVYVACQGGAE